MLEASTHSSCQKRDDSTTNVVIEQMTMVSINTSCIIKAKTEGMFPMFPRIIIRHPNYRNLP